MAGSGRKVVLTHTVLSPSLQRAIDAFCGAHGAEHVQVDAVSHSALRTAAKQHRVQIPSLPSISPKPKPW